MLKLNKIHQGDCLERLKDINDNSVDLVLIDPPYNIGKDEWDKVDNYIEWFGTCIKETQRVLKDNGSFYFFHNQFTTMSKIQLWIEKNTNFIFKSLITWEKYQTNKQYYGRNVLMGVNKICKRNYFPMSEYCLFYTFEDLSFQNNIVPLEVFKPIRDYLKEERKKAKDIGFSSDDFRKLMGLKLGGGLRYFGDTAWIFPNKEHYISFQKTGFFKKSYAELNKQYETLRKKYEESRYTFNFVRTDITTTWLYPPAKKDGHLTPKPIKIIKDIILHSSNEGDLVLDFFIGSGTTAVACKELGRNFIGIEKEQKYVDIGNSRLAQTTQSVQKTQEDKDE